MEKIKLPEPFRTDWIKALRSGKYKQTNYCLRDSVGYCCLGVACDIILTSPEAKDLIGECSMPYELECDAEEHNITHNIPEALLENKTSNKIRELIGKKDYSQLLKEVSLDTFLAQVNDDQNWSFDQIADWLEEYTIAE